MKASFQTLLTEYPSGMKVNALLASKCWGVNEKYIVPGNGAAELIKCLMDSLQGKLGVIRPSFEEYPNRYQGEVVTFIPENRDFRYTGQDIIDYFANTDKKTPLNFTNHAYWNLNGDGTIYEHELFIDSKYL